MEQEPELKRRRKRPMWFAFLLGAAGLLLVDGAMHWFVNGHYVLRASAMLALSLVVLVLAMLWGSSRI